MPRRKFKRRKFIRVNEHLFFVDCSILLKPTETEILEQKLTEKRLQRDVANGKIVKKSGNYYLTKKSIDLLMSIHE